MRRQVDNGREPSERSDAGSCFRGRNLIGLVVALAVIATMLTPALASAAPFETLKVSADGHGQGYAYGTTWARSSAATAANTAATKNAKPAYATGALGPSGRVWSGSVSVDWSGCDEVTEANAAW